ncbi:hypothetical protein TJA_07680 [Thermus sp. LT1-2-5]|uniref:hypothetical protein n=1 Tax=Thermus sp. LT1-2-5 TaxID=3026935 RepID=UPI0030E90CE5
MVVEPISVDREEEKRLRQNLAYAGAGLLLKGRDREALAFILASQALYTRQLLEVLEVLERGDVEEAAWLAFGYTHHPTLEKRPVMGPPLGGWRPIWRLLAQEGLDPKAEPGASLVALAHTGHLGEITAVLATHERKGLETALKVAQALLETRPVAFRYGLHMVSGALPKGRA